MYASLLNFTKDRHRSSSLGAAVNVGPVGQSCVSLFLDRPWSYVTKHRTHLHEPQPSTSCQKSVYCLHKNHKYVVVFSLYFTDDPLFY